MTMWVFVARWEWNGGTTGFADDLGNRLDDDDTSLLTFLGEARPEDNDDQYSQLGFWDDPATDNPNERHPGR
jgi:hypothetical protein